MKTLNVIENVSDLLRVTSCNRSINDALPSLPTPTTFVLSNDGYVVLPTTVGWLMEPILAKDLLVELASRHGMTLKVE